MSFIRRMLHVMSPQELGEVCDHLRVLVETRGLNKAHHQPNLQALGIAFNPPSTSAEMVAVLNAAEKDAIAHPSSVLYALHGRCGDLGAALSLVNRLKITIVLAQKIVSTYKERLRLSADWQETPQTH